jgi:hypothetical protein
MGMRTLLFAVIALTVICAGQDAPPAGAPQLPQQQAEKPKADCVIKGQVINAVTGKPLDTTQGVPSSIEIEMSTNGPELNGSVTKDGKTFAGAFLVLIPDDENRRGEWGGYGTASSDQYGNCKIRNLRPGDYKALAVEEIEGVEYMDPEFLKTYSGKTSDVSLKEGQKETLQFTVVRAEGVVQG